MRAKGLKPIFHSRKAMRTKLYYTLKKYMLPAICKYYLRYYRHYCLALLYTTIAYK